MARLGSSGAAMVGSLSLLALGANPPAAIASSADPAGARIEAFHASLVEMMKQGSALGPRGRYHRLEPVVEADFDLPLMTRFAGGPAWASMSAADQGALVKAFGKLSAASYAHNFDRYGGERFDLDPVVQARGPDKIVQAHLITGGHAPVALAYRMRLSGGAWKIVDVYYDGISQLTTRRSDFAAPLAAGGAKALLAHLDSVSAKLLQ